MIQGLLRDNRKKLDEDLKGAEKRRFFTPATYGK